MLINEIPNARFEHTKDLNRRNFSINITHGAEVRCDNFETKTFLGRF